jgi:hypothetical protein
MAEAGKLMPIATLCPKFVTDHWLDESREVREKVMQANTLI